MEAGYQTDRFFNEGEIMTPIEFLCGQYCLTARRPKEQMYRVEKRARSKEAPRAQVAWVNTTDVGTESVSEQMSVEKAIELKKWADEFGFFYIRCELSRIGPTWKYDLLELGPPITESEARRTAYNLTKRFEELYDYQPVD